MRNKRALPVGVAAMLGMVYLAGCSHTYERTRMMWDNAHDTQMGCVALIPVQDAKAPVRYKAIYGLVDGGVGLQFDVTAQLLETLTISESDAVAVTRSAAIDAKFDRILNFQWPADTPVRDVEDTDRIADASAPFVLVYPQGGQLPYDAERAAIARAPDRTPINLCLFAVPPLASPTASSATLLDRNGATLNVSAATQFIALPAVQQRPEWQRKKAVVRATLLTPFTLIVDTVMCPIDFLLSGIG